jgi:PAS domain S-box-containing protein
VSVVSVSSDPHRHAALEALADGFCMADRDFRVTSWNAAAERLFGISRAEAVGRTLWAVLPGMDDREVRERVARAAERGAVLTLSLTSDRELFARHLAVHIAPIEGGGVAVHLRDATGEQRLADQYAQLLESMRDGFIAVDREWRIVYVNRAAEVLVLLRRDRAIGADIRELLPAEPTYLHDALGATMQDREPRVLVALFPVGRVFRGRSFDVQLHPLPDGGLSILFEDVTERLAKEVELARLAAEAEEANRAKSRFFAAVSHELRTPLNAIVGYTHLLATHTYGDVPAGASRAAERASVCAEHLARLVDDVLLLTTAEIDRLPLFRSAVELDAFLPGILQHLTQQAEAKRLEFEVEVEPGLPALETDAERLRQVVASLVGNAIKFTSNGGVRVRARAAGEAGWVEVVVEDTGPGVSDENRELIFAPFEQIGDGARSDSLNRGTGLGLTISRRLARLLGGDIEVRGGSEMGAEFVLRLPLHPATAEANGASTNAAPAPTASG